MVILKTSKDGQVILDYSQDYLCSRRNKLKILISPLMGGGKLVIIGVIFVIGYTKRCQRYYLVAKGGVHVFYHARAFGTAKK